MFLSIYTPLYNKKDTIQRTFDSLLNQSDFDFEWIIINDGSTDNSGIIAEQFKTDKFNIKYVKKENEGLSSAMNLGSKLAKGDFILRLDPDDYLDPKAVETIYDRIIYNKFQNANIGCYVFLTKFENGNINGYHPFNKTTICSFWDYRHRYHAIGDRAEVFVSSAFKLFNMPSFKGEKFCPESILWNRFSDRYNAVYFNDAIYIREYNNNSMTSSWPKIGYENPKGIMVALIDLLKRHITLRERILYSVNYYRYSLRADYSLYYLMKQVPWSTTAIGLIMGATISIIEKHDVYFVKKAKQFFSIKS